MKCKRMVIVWNVIMIMNNLKELKNSILLKELKRRMKQREIRFNWTYCKNCGDNPDGLISWNALDEYEIDFAEIEKVEDQARIKFEKEFDQKKQFEKNE
jgi:hypothetical protein